MSRQLTNNGKQLILELPGQRPVTLSLEDAEFLFRNLKILLPGFRITEEYRKSIDNLKK